VHQVFSLAAALAGALRACLREAVIVWASLVALTLLATAAHSHGVTHGDLVLDHPYAVPSLVGVHNGAAYLRGINNRGDKPDRLLSGSSPVAARVELHRMTIDTSHVMRMRQVLAIELPPQTMTPLRHNGEYHLMLMDLKQPLKDGDRFDLTLNFELAGRQTVKVWVQTPRDANRGEHRH
jgi:copper(I)-binding protein